MTKTASLYYPRKNYPYRLSQGVFVETVADASWTGEQALANRGIRTVIDAAQISTSGSTVRVTFVAGASEGVTIDGAYIGHQAGAGDIWDFDGGQVRITFNGGSNGVTIAANDTATSDEISFSLDETKNLVVATGIANNTSSDTVRRATSATGFNSTNKASANGEEGTTDVTGYSSNPSQRDLVGKIEVK